ncbi:hypothetical protein H0H92_016105, partial [Tricholoma furcatifolium]
AWASAVYSDNSKEFGISFSVGSSFVPYAPGLSASAAVQHLGSIHRRRSTQRVTDDGPQPSKDHTVFFKAARLATREIYIKSAITIFTKVIQKKISGKPLESQPPAVDFRNADALSDAGSSSAPMPEHVSSSGMITLSDLPDFHPAIPLLAMEMEALALDVQNPLSSDFDSQPLVSNIDDVLLPDAQENRPSTRSQSDNEDTPVAVHLEPPPYEEVPASSKLPSERESYARQPTTVDPREGDKIRKRAGRFRVLIVGRANSGKTTILQRVCKSAKAPVIYGPGGFKIDIDKVLQPSAERGLHDIEDEMIFKSNPKFIFHDSRGFEAGVSSELSHVKKFLRERARKRKLKDRVHVVWYCIPLHDNRPVTAAERAFFDECGTGHVPLIVLFTKLDALDDRSFEMLMKENPKMSHEEADERAPVRSQKIFEGMLEEGLKPIFDSRYPPKGRVALRSMDQEEADCTKLLEVTAEALDDERLKLLLIATQQQSLKLCTAYGIRKLLARMESTNEVSAKEVESIILPWYPHVLNVSFYQDECVLDANLRITINAIQDSPTIQAKLANIVNKTGNVESLVSYQIAQLGLSLAIIAEHSYFLKQKNPHLNFKESIEAALDAYLESNSYPNVMRAVQALKFPRAGRKNSVLRLGSGAKADEVSDEQKRLLLHETLLQIILDNHITSLPQEDINM